MKTTELDIEQVDGSIIKFIMIDLGNNQFISMTKETYDKMQAEQSTPIVIDEAKTK